MICGPIAVSDSDELCSPLYWAVASEHELWAIALKVERDHGDSAPRHIAQRIGAAAIAGEWDAVNMWKAVALRFDQLRKRPYAYA